MSTSALLEELVREEWARTQASKPVPAGFTVNARSKNGSPTIEVGGDDIDVATLTITQADDLVKSAALVLAGRRTFCSVVGTGGWERVDGDMSWVNGCTIIDVAKQGRGYVVSTIVGQGVHQRKKSQAISGPLLKDLMAAITDRALNVSTHTNLPQSGDGLGSF